MPVCGVCGYSVIQLNQIISSHYSTLTEDPIFLQNNSKIFNVNNIFLSNASNYSNKYSSNIYYDKINSNYQLKRKNKYFLKKFKYKPDYWDKQIIYSERYNSSSDIIRVHEHYINADMKKIKRREYNEIKNAKLKIHTNELNDNINNMINIQDKNKKDFRYLEGYEIQDPNLIPNNPTENDDDETKKSLLFNSNVTKYGFSLIFTLIEAVIHSIQIIYNFHFISVSPYLDRTIFGMWNSKVFSSYVLLIGINKFATYVLTIFPSWCTIVYHIFIIFVDIYIFYYTIFQPFIKVPMNCFFQSLLTYNMISNIIIVLYNFKLFADYFSIMPFIFLVFFPFFIIYYIINKKIISAVNKKLSPKVLLEDQDSDEETNFSDEIPLKRSNKIFKRKKENQHFYQMTDDEKREMFDNYVFQSIDHALLYFRVGASSLSPYFIDFSFIRYMKETYGQIPIQISLLRLISFFPSEHQFLNYGISLLTKREDFMNAYEQFAMYQLHRINIIRQSNVSKELQSELTLLDNMSDEAISSIRGFWAEIFQAKTVFELSSLRFIRKMTLNTNSCYIDALEKFPNSTQILNSYCRFLCEGCGDYIECVRVGQKIKLIEQGKHVNADFCFHAFVNAFPQYLKQNILNEKGNFVQEGSSSVSSQISTGQISASFDNISGLHSMNSSASGDSSKNFNYSIANRKRNKVDLDNLIEQENFETLINTLFNSGRSRLTIQQIVERSRNRPLLAGLIISIAQTLCFLCVIFLEIGFTNSYDSPIQLLESTARTSKVAFSFQYCSLIAGIQYLSGTHKLNVSSKIIDFLNIRNEDLPQFPCSFMLPLFSLNSMTKSIVNLIDKEMKFIMTNPKNHKDQIKIYTNLNYEDLIQSSVTSDSIVFISKDWDQGVRIYKLSNGGNYSYYKMTLRNALEYFSAVVDRLAFENALETLKPIINNTNSSSKMSQNSSLPLDDPNQTKFKNIYFELLINGLTISEPFSHMFRIISQNGINMIKSNENTLIVTIVVITIVGLIFFSLARIICYKKIIELMNMQEKAITKVKDDDILELMKPIYLKSQRIIKVHSTSSHSIYETSSIMFLYAIISFLSIVLLLSFFLISAFQFKSVFGFIESAQQWENDAASRFLYLTMMMNFMISQNLGILSSNLTDDIAQNTLKVLNLSQQFDLSIIGKGRDLKQFYFMVNKNATTSVIRNKKIQQPKQMRNLNRKVNPSKKSILSLEEEIELATEKLKCDELDNSNSSTRMNFATFLDCISLENRINLGIQFFKLMENSAKIHNLIESPDFITALFILDKYLYQDLPKFQDIITSTAQSESKKKKNNAFIVGVAGAGVSVLILIIEILMEKQINFCFEAFKQLIKVLPPSAFTNNSYLANFLIGSFKNKNPFLLKIEASHSNSLSEEEILLRTVNEGVVNTDQNLIIQSVNPAIQKITGFLPDQLLGQTLLYLIPHRPKYEENKDSVEKYPFYQRIGEIRGSSGSRIAELNAKVLTDKGQEILVRATIIGMFDKNRKNNNNNNQNKTIKNTSALNKNNKGVSTKFLAIGDLLKENNTGDDDDESTTSTTTIDTYNPNQNQQIRHNNNDDDLVEEFVGITVILQDISKENKLKKDLKRMKRKNEILLGLLLPQPVLENIRASKKPAYYFSNPATLIKFELDGFDEYTGTMVPKTIMTNLQTIYSKIDKALRKNKNTIPKKNLLCDKEEINQHQNIQPFADGNSLFSSRFPQLQNSIMRFNFNFDLTSLDEPDEDIQIHGLSSSKMVHSKTLKSQADDDEELDVENDENCDFDCIYNIRNDNDHFVYVAGLFDSQNELKKQAESCLRFALKVNKIIENIGLDNQVNMFIHIKIAVCMGGPIFGFVDDPENPQIEIFSNLINEADEIRNHADLDVVYINENVYNNIDKNKFEIEEKSMNYSSVNDKGEIEENVRKVYVVHKCVKVKNDDSVFAVSSDSEN